jgi:multiple sugar transport system permease protein
VVGYVGDNGATKLQLARHVIIPHLKPAIIVMTLMPSSGPSTTSFICGWPWRQAPASTPTLWRPRCSSRRSSTGRLGYSTAVGIVMATIMLIFGAVYLRFIAAREFKEVL